MILMGETEELGEKHALVPLCPPQIPHGLTRACTQASKNMKLLQNTPHPNSRVISTYTYLAKILLFIRWHAALVRLSSNTYRKTSFGAPDTNSTNTDSFKRPLLLITQTLSIRGHVCNALNSLCVDEILGCSSL
jgi:hypothetical protein